jgi:hypothetical protein
MKTLKANINYPTQGNATTCQNAKGRMQLLSSRMQQIEWRRSQVLELSSKGHNQSEIARILQIDKSIISRDIVHIREQCKDNIKKYIDDKLPQEYEKCLTGLTAILKEAWNMVQETNDERERIHALQLAKDCYEMKLDLLTNATVVETAIKFVSINFKNRDDANGLEKDKALVADNEVGYTANDFQGSKENSFIRSSTYNKIF